MVPVLAPAQLEREVLACTVLGAVLGAGRAFFPAKGRGAFVPDVLVAGAVLFAVQSYAAAVSEAGVLRWYMLAACAAGALAADYVLGTPVRAAGRGIHTVITRLWRRAARRHSTKQKKPRKQRRDAQRTAKNKKKSLPNQRPVLYNSNVSK